ncbi:MAG: aminotransferase class V-fold PLP-dependent enzyme [Clostridiales bacterium]|nr:aminotransferase class V-fold PLP-dependent enzyme [Clostridiales bacterium]
MNFQTKAIHAGHKHDKSVGAHATPIYQTSTFVFDNCEQGARRFEGIEEGYIYSRLGNPNMTELEEKMTALENGGAAISTGSGMAAISTVLLSQLKAGNHMVAGKALYGCTNSLMTHVLPRFNIETTFVDTTDLGAIEQAINNNTKVIYIETPANPTMQVTDIKAVSKIARKYGAVLVADNTFMTPYLQKPLDLGADIVVHSATKYICGHGDVVAGIIVSSKETIMDMKFPYFKDFGGNTSPFDAWLLVRGLKTLPARVDIHCKNAKVVVDYLLNHPAISDVYYPGLKEHPQHDIAKKQATDFGAMIAFELKGGIEAGKTLMNNVKMIALAVSLGCVDSLIQHPASMTHSPVSREDRLKAGITDGLVRISVGIEHVEDIISDLGQALAKI